MSSTHQHKGSVIKSHNSDYTRSIELIRQLADKNASIANRINAHNELEAIKKKYNGNLPQQYKQNYIVTPLPETKTTLKQSAQTKPHSFFNFIKAIATIAFVLLCFLILLNAFFGKQKSDTNDPEIEYTIVSTTINGQFYEKEATPEDLNSAFVTFADGTRVPWSDVKAQQMRISASELSNALNLISTAPNNHQ